MTDPSGQTPFQDRPITGVFEAARVTDEVATVSARDEGATLREKLEWLMLFRLVIVTFLLGSAVVVNVNDVESFGDPSYVALISLIVTTYAATLGYVSWIRAQRSLDRLVYVQLVGDVILVGGIVFLTGGIDSIFVFLFFLSIFNGAILTGSSGARFAATGSALGLASVMVVQYARIPAVIARFPESIPRSDEVPIYAMVIHLVAFYAVGALSGYLAEKLGQVGTELEQRRLDVRALKALNENIVRSVSSGLVSVDLQRRVTYLNIAAEEILQLDGDALVGRTLETGLPAFANVLDHGLPGGVDGRAECEWIRDGSDDVRILGLSTSTLRDADGTPTGTIIVFQDLTEVRALQSEVERQRHLAAIGNLSAAIAHEVRNPLAAISGSVELLKHSIPSDDAESEMLMSIVIRETERLNGLISDFLEYARPHRVQRRLVDVVDLIRSTADSVRVDRDLTGDVEVRVESDIGRPLDVRVDPDRIQQVLWNLMRNACEATRGHGDSVLVRVHIDEDDPVLVVAIEDSGPGFAPEALENLFVPFFTTKDSGTGLGLATCHRLVTAHGGLLQAENRTSGGARLTMVLPLVGDGAVSEDEASRVFERTGTPIVAHPTVQERDAVRAGRMS